MILDAEHARHGTRRFELADVTLAIVNGQRIEREALRPDHRRCRVGIQTAAQQHYRSHG